MNKTVEGYSLNDLLNFLDFLAGKGLMNPETAASQKVACNKVFGILDDEEKQDISNLDLESIFQRYGNLQSGKVTPSTMKTYFSRVRSTYTDFQAYRVNPADWKPSIQSRSPRSKGQTEKLPKVKIDEARNVSESNGNSNNGENHSTLYPYPLRPDTTVNISGLPLDLNVAEARRLAAFIATLAVDFDPSVGWSTRQPALSDQ